MRTFFAAAVVVAMAASPAYAQDPFVGEFGSNCRPEHQCFIDISKVGNKYKINWVTANRMDASKIVCSVQRTVAKKEGALHGKWEGSRKILIETLSGGSIAITGTDNGASGRTLPVNGVYTPIGD